MADNHLNSPGNVKNKSCQMLTKPKQSIVIKLYLKKKKDNPKQPYHKIINDIARELSLPIFIVQKTLCNNKKIGNISSVKNVNNLQTIHNKLSEQDKISIRQVVHSFYMDQKLPTIDKVYNIVNSNNELPCFKRSSFYLLLKRLHFRLTKMKKNSSVLTEKNRMILLRRNYLENIKNFRNDGRTIYYLDETCIDLEEKSYVCRTPAEVPNKILILLHICSSKGFIPNGLLCVESTTALPSISQEMFIEWFENILTMLDNNCVIVMDQASCHSAKFDRIPNAGWKKEDILSWMVEKQLPFKHTMIKAELLDIIIKNRDKFDKFIIDETARRRYKKVLRLPLYHNQMNLMEYAWSMVKNSIRYNTISKDIYYLVTAGLNSMTTKKWNKCLEEVIKKENEFWNLDDIMDQVLDDIDVVTDYNESSNCTESSDNEDT
ncbi:uncharacterized protein LOC126897746 [Daktulosphaira vitifoliae]|uniref:uncharacterized protein LOC126897746 n=1 Tax=Daktulosphaira vitifoliae TaxID=58002 RepID=UPI0021AA1FD5|nr:uncharacterized protein LOC126897746 [Daktulosphaira vitifoliae]